MKGSSELRWFFNVDSWRFPYKLMLENDRSVVYQRLDAKERTFILIVNTSSHYYSLSISSVGIRFPSAQYSFHCGCSSMARVIERIRELC